MNKLFKYIFPATICLTLAFLAIAGFTYGEKSGTNRTQDSLAIELYGKMLKTFNDSVRGLKDIAHYDSAFHRAGNLCYDTGRYIEAFEFYTYDLDLAQRSGNKYHYFSSLANIGLVYDVFREYNRAMYYYKLAYPHIHENGWTDLDAAVLDMMFSTSCNAGNPKQAEVYLQQRKEIKTSNPHFDQYTILKDYGQIAAAKKEYVKAIDYYKQTLKVIEGSSLPKWYDIAILLQIGSCAAEDKQYDLAIEYLSKAEASSAKWDNESCLADIYTVYAEVFENTGDKAKSDEYSRKSQQLDDKIYNSQRMDKAIARLMDMVTHLHERELQSIDLRLRQQIIVTYAITFILLLLIFTLYIVWRQKRRLMESYKLLIEKEEKIADKELENRQLKDIINQESSTNADGKDRQQEELASKVAKTINNPRYLFDADFSLDMLSREVGSNVKYTSQAIHDLYHQNFRQVVNELRIRKALTKIVEDRNSTIKDIACLLGYNSTTSFIIAFKKIVGMTPAVYKKLKLEEAKKAV